MLKPKIFEKNSLVKTTLHGKVELLKKEQSVLPRSIEIGEIPYIDAIIISASVVERKVQKSMP